jgi:hypothetical protein
MLAFTPRPLLAAALAVALALPAHAAPRAPRDSAAPRAAAEVNPSSAYCEYVNAVATSEGALLRAPWLFSSFGTLRGSSSVDSDVIAGSATDELALRFQAGLAFSPTRYYLAGLLADQAQAECERRRAELELRAAADTGGGVTRGALEAKLAVLEAALPEAQRQLEKSFAALEASRTTVQEHGALELRVDGLRQMRAETALALAALPPPPPEAAASSSSFERLRRWTAQRQALASSVRRAGALSLTLRGGYDELLGVQQSLPIFGSIALEFNPGWFWQGAADDRAERAYADAVEAEVFGQRQSLAQAAARFAAELEVVKRRRAEVDTTLADLAARRERLAAAGSATAREYAEYVWFDEVRLRADAAFLKERERTLEQLDVGADREP